MAKIGRNSSYVYVPQFLRDIRKECTHMKKRFLSTLMALVLALSLVPTAALAADLPQVGEDGFITLTDGAYTLPRDTELSNPIRVAGTATLDLNGYTLSPASDYSSNYLIKVSEGGDLTLTDTGTTGKITTNNATNIRGISNNGTFTMDSGTIEVYSYAIENVVTDESYADDQPVICNIRGGELSASYAWTVLFMGAGMAGQSGSINQGEAGSVRNDLMVVNISGDAKITGDQAITTNASNGIYAGFTLNISGDAEISGGSNTDNCGIYLPAVGVTNISGGTISGDQGIRICAGELNITGGTIKGTGPSNNADLIAGGSGGTLGAIVVGKASSGYVGDVVVNIDEGAIVENTAEGEGAAIVVSDKHMDNASMGYDELSIIVNVNGARIDGNVVKVSNVSPGNTADGGNTTLTIQDATVTGNVTNQSQTGLIIRDTTIDGNVSNTSNGSTAVLGNSTIIGSATDDANGGTLYVENGESTETYYAINERTSKVYTDLNIAISEASEGDTITLLDDIKVSLDGIDNTSGAITIDKSITLNGDENTITATSTGSKKGIAHIIVVSGSEVTIENLNLDGNNQIARYGVQAYGSGVELTLDTVSSFDNYAYGAFANNGAAVIADNLTTSGNGWGGVNVDKGGNLTINSGNLSGDTYSVVIEGTGNEATLKGGNYNLIQVKTESGETNTLTISGGNYQNIVGSDSDGNPVKEQTTVTGGNFATSIADVATTPAYEVDKNSGSYPFSYTNNYADAVEAAGPGGVVTAVNAEGTTYTVTFDYGDSRADTVSTVADDTEITLPDPGTRSGYDFTGWYSGNTRYDEGDEVTVTGNMTFTASWSERNTGSSGSDSEPSYSPVMDVSKGGSVKVNPRTPGEGDEVTITVDPDRGYEVGDVTVTDRSGRDVRVTAERDGTYTFEQPKGRVTIAVTFVREGTSTFFADVAETYWAYDEIAWAYENGYVNGVTATTFAPGASISRQQIWMILARIAGDDPADMAAARQWSIDKGISDGTNPGSAVTRQQLAALLFRFAELMGLDTTAGGMAIREFPDYEAVASYAVEAMDWAVSAGIINGTTDGTLNPTGTATRAQFAVMLYRFWTGV